MKKSKDFRHVTDDLQLSVVSLVDNAEPESRIKPENVVQKLEPRRGAIATCSIGSLGLILREAPEDITYPDGNKGKAWTGIYLADRTVHWHFGPKQGQDEFITAGSPWSSSKPNVICYVEDLLLFAKHSQVFHALVADLNINSDMDLSYFKHKLYRGYTVPANVIKERAEKMNRTVDLLTKLCHEIEILCEGESCNEPACYFEAVQNVEERTGKAFVTNWGKTREELATYEEEIQNAKTNTVGEIR
jgi:hypothetical protein